MKKILFSLESLQNEKMKYHGGGRYALNIIYLFIKNQDILKEIIFVYNSEKVITKEIKAILERKEINRIDIKNYKNKKEFENYIKENISVIFTPIREERFINLNCEIKVVFPVHDMRFYELNPDFLALKLENNYIKKIKKLIWIVLKKFLVTFYKKREKISQNDLILTVSNYSKYSILITYPYLSPENIKVLTPLNNLVDFKVKEIIGIDKDKYFLVISANRWEKNALRVIKAYDGLLDDFKWIDKKMVVVGINKVDMKLKNMNMFKFLDYVEDDELTFLYKNTFCFIYPTLNEGYGYPPAEVMRWGKPVIASAVTSVYEIYQENVEYINPYSSYEIRNKILYLLNDKLRYEELENKSLKYFQKIKRKQLELENEYINYFFQIKGE